MMRFTYLLITALAVHAMGSAQGITHFAIKTGNWNDPSVWQTGTVPVFPDDIGILTSVTVTVNIGSATSGHLSISGGGELRFASSSAVLVAGAGISLDTLTVIPNLVMTAGTLIINSSMTAAPASISATGGVIEFSGGSQDVPSATYFDLMLAGGTMTAQGDITVDGTFTITTGATFNGGAFTHRIKGDWVNGGTFSPKKGTVIIQGTDAQTVSGSTTFNNLTFSGGGIKSLQDTLTINGDVTINAASTVRAGSSRLVVAGNWTTDGTFSGQQGTVIFDGAAITITGSPTFNNLTVRGPTDVTCGDDFSVKGDCIIANQSTFDLAGTTVSFGGGWSNSGQFIGAKGTGIFNGSTDQFVDGSGKFGNMTIDNPSGIHLELGAIDTVLGILNFNQGSIWLLNGNVHLGVNCTVTGAGPGTCVITNSVGDVEHRVSGGASATPFTFPVGPDSSSYSPVTISLRPLGGEPSELFRVSVRPLSSPFPGIAALDTTRFARLRWVVTEETPGGNHANLSFQWDRADQGSQSWTVKNVPVDARLYQYDSGTQTFSVMDDATGPAPFNGPLTAGTTQYLETTFGNFLLGPPAPLPIQLVSFTASFEGSEGVVLRWTTLSELKNYGFTVQRREGESGTWAAIPGGFVQGQGTTAEPHDYAVTDSVAGPGPWEYRLEQQDLDGSLHYSEIISVSATTDIAPLAAPLAFGLAQNYPNPFNPTTTIQLTIVDRQLTIVNVYDVLGRIVATLMNEAKEPGTYDVRFDGSGLPSGVYFYRLQAGSFIQTKKLTLLR